MVGSELTILLVGQAERSEFADARVAMEALASVHRAADAGSAASLLRQGLAPDVIVIAQARPGEFSHQDVDRLRRLAPLARVLGLMGSWCEGEMRTGSPWPAVIRTYWHQWQPRCHQQLSPIGQGTCSAWALPATATAEERLLQAAIDPLPDLHGLVVIHSRRFVMADWLAAVCHSRGCSTVWLRPPRPARVEGADAAIYDGSDLRGDELEELEHLAATLGALPDGRPVPIVALLDFPRIEVSRRAISAGAAAVVSKPLHIEDLLWEMHRLAGEPSGST